jgi:hypothetical protein
MNKKTLTIPAAVAALLCAQGAHALDLRGIEVGAVTTPAALLSAMGLNNCKPTGICNDYAQFPHVVEYSSMTTVQLDNWRVMRIAVAFGAFRFEAIDKALREKLGEPNVLLHPIKQNGYGAQFQDTQEEWMDAAGNVTSLIRYATTETTSLMQMESAEEVAQAKARREADKPKL